MTERRRCRSWLLIGVASLAVEAAVRFWAPTWFFLVRDMHWLCFCIASYHFGRSAEAALSRLAEHGRLVPPAEPSESVERGLTDLAEGRTRPLGWVTTENADRRWEIVNGVTGIEDGEEATDVGI